jgi:hypothetical protein
MDWRDCAINACAKAMSTRESLINWRLRWASTRLTVCTSGDGIPSGPREQGNSSAARRELSRHVSITAGADTITDREWQRGRHPVPDDMLLAPRTDNLERGHDRQRVRVLPAFMYGISLVFHRGSPLPLATAINRRIRRTRSHSLPAARRSDRRREQRACRMFFEALEVTLYAKSLPASRMYPTSLDIIDFLR